MFFRKTLIFCSWLSGCFASLYSQTYPIFPLVGMYTHFTDARLSENHPALLARSDYNLHCAVYAQFRYIKENTQEGIQLAYRHKNYCWGLNYDFQGISWDHKHKAGLSYAGRFVKNLYIGSNLTYLHQNAVEGSPGDKILNLHLSALYIVAKRWFPSLLIRYPIPLCTDKRQEYSRSFFLKIGLAFAVSQSLGVGIEVEKDLRYPLQVHLSLSYWIGRRIWVMGAMGVQPLEAHLQMACSFPNFIIKVGSSYQSPLGACVEAGISFGWSQKNKRQR